MNKSRLDVELARLIVLRDAARANARALQDQVTDVRVQISALAKKEREAVRAADPKAAARIARKAETERRNLAVFIYAVEGNTMSACAGKFGLRADTCRGIVTRVRSRLYRDADSDMPEGAYGDLAGLRAHSRWWIRQATRV